jgi:glycerol-3-phosphate dehydrogenase (NAD(P)+)
MSLGLELGRGARLTDILAERRSVAEGVASAPAVLALAGRLGVEMPIAAAVDAILHHDASVDEAIAGLLSRPFKGEWD